MTTIKLVKDYTKFFGSMLIIILVFWSLFLVDNIIVVNSKLNHKDISVKVEFNRNTNWFGDNKLAMELRGEIYQKC